jgi:hypothetical protein
MVAPMVSHKATHINRLDEGGIPWLAMLLGMSIVVFFFQLFPSVWWSGVSFVLYLLSYLDVRAWTWRSYAVVCSLTIVGLVAMKAWLALDN